MVVLEPLNQLLQAKWDLLRPRFFFNFLCFLTYMLIFTAVVYCEPALEKARLGRGGAYPGEAPGNSPGRSWDKDTPTPTPRLC